MAHRGEKHGESLASALARAQAKVEETLAAILPPAAEGPEGELFGAMRYATLEGGKRLRPFLVVASASLFDVPEAVALRVGAAVELIHSYSLIHDDLPCMDDDALRRGKPACHVRFGESTAVLAGDALMPLAFEVLADPATHPDASVRAALVVGLARAAGPRGMVGGQVLDLAAERVDLDVGGIARLERLKTGSLIAFAVDAGAILGRAPEAERKALAAYAHDLGLAYQMADDLLDVEGSAGATGKEVGKDARRGKATFVALLGVAQARDQARRLAEQAASHLEPFGPGAGTLRALARYVVERPA
ncbi:MAG TPA: farnesyl diphosphate synthase [Alphaproteobacteria bacterium]|jgi:farnesyl diphosphate synthase